MRCPTTDEEQKVQDKIRASEARARVPREHPEDRKMRLDGEVYGREHAKAFSSDHAAMMADLIGFYSDADAHARLDDLRERFWGREWVPSKR